MQPFPGARGAAKPREDPAHEQGGDQPVNPSDDVNAAEVPRPHPVTRIGGGGRGVEGGEAKDESAHHDISEGFLVEWKWGHRVAQSELGAAGQEGEEQERENPLKDFATPINLSTFVASCGTGRALAAVDHRVGIGTSLLLIGETRPCRGSSSVLKVSIGRIFISLAVSISTFLAVSTRLRLFRSIVIVGVVLVVVAGDTIVNETNLPIESTDNWHTFLRLHVKTRDVQTTRATQADLYFVWCGW